MKPADMKRWIQASGSWLQQHWLVTVVGLSMVTVLMVGQAAWAAPIQSPQNQTVPKPTPTAEGGDPIGEPTPRPDEDEGSGGEEDEPTDGSSNEGDGGEVAVGPDTLQLFSEQSAEGAAEEPQGVAELLAVLVTVAQLNVREGPGTDFAIVGSVGQGDQLDLLARNTDDSWWYVCCATTTGAEGWVSADLVEPLFAREQSSELVPVFGTEPEAGSSETGSAETGDAIVTAAAVRDSAGTGQGSGEFALDMTIGLSPPYVWQGRTTRIEFLISNPHTQDTLNVELGDELPPTLEYLGSESSADGVIREEATPNGGTLILVRWPAVPAGSSVTASIEVRVGEDVPDGSVIDNLAAVRATNGARTTGGVSIGMPPTTMPIFQ